MLNHILTVWSTTLDSEVEKTYDSIINDLVHTIDKEVKMAFNAYATWQKSKSQSDLEDYQIVYKQALMHIKINLVNLSI